MRNKVAKKIKKEVVLKMYVGDGVSKQNVLKERKTAYAEPQFKSVYRARKKKHNNPLHSTVVVKHPTKPGIKFTGKVRLQRIKKSA